MKKFVVAAAALAALFAPATVLAQSIPGPQIGAHAPDFNVKGLDGSNISLASYRGKVLVLNFWATWCPPCRAETPDMIKAYNKLHGANVEFLGLDSTEQPPIIKSFLAAKNLQYPVAIDQEKRTSIAYDLRGIPTTYVIDANGIVRARYVDIITVPQLTAFVESAKSGKNGIIVSAIQKKIDAALDPSKFKYPADYQGTLLTVKAATDAIAQSNRLLGEADPAKGEATDYLQTRAEQAAVLSGAAAALAKVTHTDADKALLYRINGDVATNNENWDDAVANYAKTVQLTPKDQDAWSGLAFAYYEQKNWRAEISAYQQLNALNPDPDTYVSIGKAYLELKDWPNAIAANRKAVAMADGAFKQKKTKDSIVMSAYTWLYLGRAYAKAGETASAHNAFAHTLAYGQMLPRKSVDYAKYTEEAQEADVALALDANGRTTVSLAPWTGADLPGSLSSTVKYRLVVAARPGTNVMLRATGLSPGWIASFCTDRLCSPMQRAVTLPDSGVKIFEFQLIPNDPKAPKRTKVQVRATSVTGNATTGTVIASR